jgi:hypothetical protein
MGAGIIIDAERAIRCFVVSRSTLGRGGTGGVLGGRGGSAPPNTRGMERADVNGEWKVGRSRDTLLFELRGNANGRGMMSEFSSRVLGDIARSARST